MRGELYRTWSQLVPSEGNGHFSLILIVSTFYTQNVIYRKGLPFSIQNTRSLKIFTLFLSIHVSDANVLVSMRSQAGGPKVLRHLARCQAHGTRSLRKREESLCLLLLFPYHSSCFLLSNVAQFPSDPNEDQWPVRLAMNIEWSYRVVYRIENGKRNKLSLRKKLIDSDANITDPISLSLSLSIYIYTYTFLSPFN